MRSTTAALVVVSIGVFCTTVSADTGRFTSFSATAARSPAQVTVNVSVSTTGLVSPGTTTPDLVYVLGGVIPTTGTYFTGTGTVLTIARSGLGANAFAGSFSVTGLDPGTNYKWIALGFGDVGGLGFGFTGFYFVYFFLYYGCLPIPTTSPIFITTPSNPTLVPAACTTTPSYGGPLYDFVNSNVSTIDTTINWWYSNGTTIYPALASGLEGGRAALIAGIPTLASCGLMVLGALIALTGVILSRRG
jgi:hypothetical protein